MVAVLYLCTAWLNISFNSVLSSYCVCSGLSMVICVVTYSVTQPQAHGRFRACVWQSIRLSLSRFSD